MRHISSVKLFFIVSTLFFFPFCRYTKEIKNCGKVLYRMNFWDTSSQKFVRAPEYWPDRRIWYRDSLVILEAPGLIINIDTNGKEVRRVISDHFTYIDLSKRAFYEYLFFSDTAMFTKKYTQPDSIEGRTGWNFYAYRDMAVTEQPLNLSDTVIDRIRYQRVRFINNGDGVSNPVRIGYLRCDKKGTMFQFDKRFSEQRGCPMVRIDELPTSRNPFSNSG
ncbi:MAG: hypothetical protein JNN00_18255 [Chitinophagaceae bacterium]|nr:hypothetical protein [Chitinophagaceae bacterium]